MVPVMVTAPRVIKGQIGSMFNWIRGRSTAEATPAGFDGMAVEVVGNDAGQQHVVTKDTELIERNENGVTVISRRPAAE